MKTHIQKWGNSFAVRLPISVINALNLYSGCTIEINLEDNFLKIQKSQDSLDSLLSAITAENMHDLEIEDCSQGQEQW